MCPPSFRHRVAFSGDGIGRIREAVDTFKHLVGNQ